MPLPSPPPPQPKPATMTIVPLSRKHPHGGKGRRNCFYFEKAAATLLGIPGPDPAAVEVLSSAEPDVAAAGALLAVGQAGTKRGWNDGSSGRDAATAMDTTDVDDEQHGGDAGRLLRPLGLQSAASVAAVLAVYEQVR